MTLLWLQNFSVVANFYGTLSLSIAVTYMHDELIWPVHA